MQRINEFLNNKSTILNHNNQNTKINGDIEFNKVSFTYRDTGIKALRNVNFKIKESETLGIFGKTGSGKSTIVNLITRLYDIDEGKISIGDNNIKNLNINLLRKTLDMFHKMGFFSLEQYLKI